MFTEGPVQGCLYKAPDWKWPDYPSSEKWINKTIPMECYWAIKEWTADTDQWMDLENRSTVDHGTAQGLRVPAPGPPCTVQIQHLTPTKLSCPSVSAGMVSRSPAVTKIWERPSALCSWANRSVRAVGPPPLQVTHSTAVYWKKPHASRHMQFEPVLFRGQLTYLWTGCGEQSGFLRAGRGSDWEEQGGVRCWKCTESHWGVITWTCVTVHTTQMEVCTFYVMLIIL